MPFQSLARHRSRRCQILLREQAAVPVCAPGRNAVAHVQDAVESDRPLTWVFVGERYPVAQGRLSLAESVGGYVRDHFGRYDETLVDASAQRMPISQVEKELETRVLRNDPNVAVLMLGPGRSRVDERLEESFSLARVLCALGQNHIVPVIVPPPPFLEGGAIGEKARRWRDDVADLAIVHDAVLVGTDRCHTADAVGRKLVHALSLDKLVAAEIRKRNAASSTEAGTAQTAAVEAGAV